MQSSANVKLSPEEEMTISVSSKHFGNLLEGALRVVGMAWLSVCDCNEGIPNIPT